MVDEDAAHGLGGGSEEVLAAVKLLFSDQTQIGFMDQAGGIEGVARHLAGHLRSRERPQFVIDKWEQRRGRPAVAGLGRFEKAGDFGHATGLLVGWTTSDEKTPPSCAPPEGYSASTTFPNAKMNELSNSGNVRSGAACHLWRNSLTPRHAADMLGLGSMGSSTMSLNFAIILGSVRHNRIGLRVARYVANALNGRGHQTTLVDPVEYALPLIDRMYKEYAPGQAPETLERLAAIIRNADAYAIVSAEYNHSVPPALSNLLDHFLEEYFFKPSGIICYSAGAFGGVRAAIQLRAMLAEMGMSSIPSILPIPKAQDMFDAEGHPTGDRPGKSAARFFDELEWYATALQRARAEGVPY